MRNSTAFCAFPLHLLVTTIVFFPATSVSTTLWIPFRFHLVTSTFVGTVTFENTYSLEVISSSFTITTISEHKLLWKYDPSFLLTCRYYTSFLVLQWLILWRGKWFYGVQLMQHYKNNLTVGIRQRATQYQHYRNPGKQRV